MSGDLEALPSPHTCPLCCDSYDFVLNGAGMSFDGLREFMDSRPRWWRWVHPARWAFMRGQRFALADVLDDARK